MPLKATYDDERVHQRWGAAYRNHPGQEILNDRILARALRVARLPPGALVLDAGCGSAEHANRLARRGFRCVGVDLSWTILQHASAKGSGIALCCGALEELCFREATFDAVYCRGVLMHIPDWQAAVGQLCRVLKRGGRLLILEANHRSLEASLVRLIRRVRSGRSRIIPAPGGLEFWSELDGQPFLVRITNLHALGQELRRHGVDLMGQFPTEFWDVGRFPEGSWRNTAIRFNQAWFGFARWAALSAGVALVGLKQEGTGGG